MTPGRTVWPQSLSLAVTTGLLHCWQTFCSVNHLKFVTFLLTCYPNSRGFCYDFVFFFAQILFQNSLPAKNSQLFFFYLFFCFVLLAARDSNSNTRFPNSARTTALQSAQVKLWTPTEILAREEIRPNLFTHAFFFCFVNSSEVKARAQIFQTTTTDSV